MAKNNYYNDEEEYEEVQTQEEIDDSESLANYRLIREERETIITYNDLDGIWEADTAVQKHIRKFEKQGWECVGKQYYPDGTLMSAQFKGNAKSISIRDINEDKPKRIMSEEHKQKLQEARLKMKQETIN